MIKTVISYCYRPPGIWWCSENNLQAPRTGCIPVNRSVSPAGNSLHWAGLFSPLCPGMFQELIGRDSEVYTQSLLQPSLWGFAEWGTKQMDKLMLQLHEKQWPKQCRNLKPIKISARGRCVYCSPPRDKYTTEWDLTQRLLVMQQHSGSENVSVSSVSLCLFRVCFLV